MVESIQFSALSIFRFLQRTLSSRRTKGLVLGILFLAYGMTISVSTTTQYNFGPDEVAHTRVAEFYHKHWIPPGVGDKRAVDTYSNYGFSYIDELDSAYFFAGKFTKLFGDPTLPYYANARKFQLVLFGLVLCLLLATRYGWILGALLAMVPQSWYIFSYFSSDAFYLTVSLFLAYQIASKDSSFSRKFLQNRLAWRSLPYTLGVSILLGILLLGKKNYYIFLVYLVGYVFWTILFYSDQKIDTLKKWLVVAGIGLAIALPRIAQDFVLNGWDKSQKRLEYANQVAQDNFKPKNYGTGKGVGNIRIKDQGVRFFELITLHKWHHAKFESFFGVFGHMNLPMPREYYRNVGIFGTAFLLSLVLMALIWRRIPIHLLLMGTIGVVFLAILVSLYHSWTADYQPQGRYLFPAIPILGMYLLTVKDRLPNFIFIIPVILGAIGLHSYLNTCVRLSPKYENSQYRIEYLMATDAKPVETFEEKSDAK